MIGLIVASVLLIVTLINLLATGSEINIITLLISFGYAFIITFSIGIANTLTINYLQKKLPWQKISRAESLPSFYGPRLVQ
jgi:hypothetical protein